MTRINCGVPTNELANKIYDVLVNLGGASEHERSGFIYHHVDSKDGCDEWRFQGKLGYGGKYRSRYNTVDCYQEDETKERLKLIKQINSLLFKVKI